MYARTEKMLTKNGTTVDHMKKFLQYFAGDEKKINSGFALDWAVLYNLTETLSTRDVLNDYFEYKLDFKGKNAKAVKEYLAAQAKNQGFEYLPKCLVEPGFRPQDDSTIRADLERCKSSRQNIRTYLTKIISKYHN